LDHGQRQALALAKELQADLILLDDKVARRFAEQVSLKVKATFGVLADAAKIGVVDFRAKVEQFQRTSTHLNTKLAQQIIEEFEKSQERV